MNDINSFGEERAKFINLLKWKRKINDQIPVKTDKINIKYQPTVKVF